MESGMPHLLLTTFAGHADVTVPGLTTAACRVPIRFDPQALRLEAFLPATDPVCRALVDERRSVAIHLCNVVLGDPAATVQLRAQELRLYRNNPLSEWPEWSGLPACELEPEARETRRLELAPSAQQLEFIADDELSRAHPFQVYFGGALAGLRAPLPLERTADTPAVSFCCNHPQSGVLCAFGEEDFFSLEPRIHAAWMLIHGRRLAPVLQIQGRKIGFFGHTACRKPSYLPLLDGWGSALPDSVMRGFVYMERDRFSKAYRALKYFLEGKQADASLEARYMLLMNCVEAMDGVWQLTESTTAALLGVSDAAAFLFNGMRNKLVHGHGSYAQAFAALGKDKLDSRQPQMEPELAGCIQEQQLDFVQLWFRLCERLDAFWCAYLGVPADMVQDRYSPVTLMPAVDLPALDRVIKQCQNTGNNSDKESPEMEELRRQILQLKQKNDDLKEKLKEQGQAYARLKSELGSND